MARQPTHRPVHGHAHQAPAPTHGHGHAHHDPAPAPAPRTDDDGGKTGARIRMYRVGFGDFFTLSVPAEGGLAHILIDCGVHAKDLGVIGDAVAKLKADTGGKLALVIMTHRHADHISGFAKARDLFETFSVERVWMSGFENRGDKQAMRIQAQIAATAMRLQAALAAAPADDEHVLMAGNALGVAGAGNDAALEMLHGFKTAAGEKTPVDYYWAGQPATLPPVLEKAGLEAEILGPPQDPQLLAQMDNKAHQYLAGADGEEEAPAAPFAPAYRVAAFPWPPGFKSIFPIEQVVANIHDAQTGIVAAAAQNADNSLNNQSLVVLFTFGGKTMLFAGDAQWGNWANFLFGGPIGTPGHTGLTKRAQDILSNLDFYKVGHHGSTNATPKDVVDAIGQRCVAMCSTAIGAYGKEKSNSEVPRLPLIAALDAKTGQHLARSDQVAVGDIAADPKAGALPNIFTPGPAGSGFVDYLL